MWDVNSEVWWCGAVEQSHSIQEEVMGYRRLMCDVRKDNRGVGALGKKVWSLECMCQTRNLCYSTKTCRQCSVRIWFCRFSCCTSLHVFPTDTKRDIFEFFSSADFVWSSSSRWPVEVFDPCNTLWACPLFICRYILYKMRYYTYRIMLLYSKGRLRLSCLWLWKDFKMCFVDVLWEKISVQPAC